MVPIKVSVKDKQIANVKVNAAIGDKATISASKSDESADLNTINESFKIGASNCWGKHFPNVFGFKSFYPIF